MTEEIGIIDKERNPFSYKSWVDQGFGFSESRRKKLAMLLGKDKVSISKEFLSNDGLYIAFVAIRWGFAEMIDGKLKETEKWVENYMYDQYGQTIDQSMAFSNLKLIDGLIHKLPMFQAEPIVERYLTDNNIKTTIMTKKITRPASLVRQGALTLYATSLKVSDLLIPNFYSIERLDPENANEKGYQRLLNKGRAKKLADYIVAGQETRDAFLPTSIFIATNKDISFNHENNTIDIDIDEVGPFNVVDGQHRVEGLKMAAEKDIRILDFEVPVNIAINLPNIAQMCHFLIVNTTQKSVEKGVEQRIYQRLTQASEVEDIPHLPRWISKIIDKGEDDLALKYVDFLNSDLDSPWLNKIKMANKENNEGSINQQSFVKSIKKYVLVGNNPITIQSSDKQHKIFLNYWKAITNILGLDEPTVLFKYNGVDLFCRFSVPFFNKMINKSDFKVSTMQAILLQVFEEVEGDYVGVGHTDFWIKGGNASFLNSGAINVINSEMVKALHKTNFRNEIET